MRAMSGSRTARNPPMFTRLSFFEDTVAPSEYEVISRRMSRTDRSSYPASRCLMNQAFSRARVASSITRIPLREHRAGGGGFFFGLCGCLVRLFFFFFFFGV